MDNQIFHLEVFENSFMCSVKTKYDRKCAMNQSMNIYATGGIPFQSNKSSEEFSWTRTVLTGVYDRKIA